MKVAVIVDLAGGQLGGAARFRAEVTGYLHRTARADVRAIGARRHLGPAWMAIREAAAARVSTRVALNNVGFLARGGERRTLLANALHFPTVAETAALEPGLRSLASRQAMIVHAAARRSDVLVAPCTAMAERITAALPDVANRVVVRMHPVSASPVPRQRGGSLILCPVIFASYKHMDERLREWLEMADRSLDESVRMIVTASPADLPQPLAANPRLHLVGTLGHDELFRVSARSRALYFPPGLESFGFPLAEARVNGQPVIALDTPQNREIAGQALCGYAAGDPDSLRHATEAALAAEITPDAAPFDPDAYFDWLLGTA